MADSQNPKMVDSKNPKMADSKNPKVVGASNKNDAKKFSALVVDDDAIIRIVAQKLLDNHGFKTKSVTNGQEAIDIFTAGNSFDVILMDMEMPVMDGIQTTKELRARGVKTLIYGITASQSKTDIQAFIEAGLNDYFEKPLDIAKIDSILKQLND